MHNSMENVAVGGRYSRYTLIGILLLFAVNMLYAVKDVIAGHLLSKNTSVMSIMFVVFLIAVISFSAVDLCPAGMRPAPQPKRAGLKDILLLNVATAFSWWGYFYSLKFIEPAVAGAFIGGLVILFAWALNRLFRRHAPASANDLWTTLTIFLLGGLLMCLSLDGRSAMGGSMARAETLHGFFGGKRSVKG